MAPSLGQRSVEDVVSDIQDKFSWDYCMSKSYCKWPVIIGIIILSLTLLSIVFCIVRCICCGASCCCGCLSCLNCCCSSRRKKSHQKLPTYPQPSSYFPTQYQERLPPMYNGAQVAQFDASKNNPGIDEDALPAMPTWETSSQKRIENSVPAYGAGSMEMKPIDAGSPYAWAQGKTKVPTGYNPALSPPHNGAANEYYSNQTTGFYDSRGTMAGFGDTQAYSTYNNQTNAFESMPYSTSNGGMRYEPYRNMDYANTYGEPQTYGGTPGFSQQQTPSNSQPLRNPAAGAWRDL